MNVPPTLKVKKELRVGGTFLFPPHNPQTRNSYCTVINHRIVKIMYYKYQRDC